MDKTYRLVDFPNLIRTQGEAISLVREHISFGSFFDVGDQSIDPRELRLGRLELDHPKDRRVDEVEGHTHPGTVDMGSVALRLT